MYPARRYGFVAALLFVVPTAARAQQISNTIALAALSPIAVVLLAGVAGWLERSPARGLLDAGLILIWVVVFVVFSYWVTVDWIIWTPVVLYAFHSAWIALRLIRAAVARWRRA